MKLNVNDDHFKDNPSLEVIAQAIIGADLDSFVILSRADEDYIQTYYNEDASYLLEFRAGSYDKHFRAKSETLNQKQILTIFEAFFQGATDWSRAWEWEKVEFDENFEGDV